jgi:hypothetical protein
VLEACKLFVATTRKHAPPLEPAKILCMRRDKSTHTFGMRALASIRSYFVDMMDDLPT